VSEGGRERRKNLEQEMRGEAGESGCVGGPRLVPMCLDLRLRSQQEEETQKELDNVSYQQQRTDSVTQSVIIFTGFQIRFSTVLLLIKTI